MRIIKLGLKGLSFKGVQRTGLIGFAAVGATLFVRSRARPVQADPEHFTAHSNNVETVDVPFGSFTSRNIRESIGRTPLIELKSLSAATGCTILAKAEHLNPGGSVKDRPALLMLEEAEKSGLLKPGGTVVEGTGGNTGVGLAMLAAASGYRGIMCMPNTISAEKQQSMKLYGSEVVLCEPVPFSDGRHYFHTASRLAAEIPGAYWTNQFENLANYKAHFTTTAPEIWSQARGKVDAIALSAGTGGTIAGLSSFLKTKNPNLICYLVDGPSSGLFNFVTKKEFAPTTLDQSNATPSSSDSTSSAPKQSPNPSLHHGKPPPPKSAGVYEGIGIMRLTANFSKAQVDYALGCSDREGVEMCYFLLRNEGLWVGPSAALNVVGAVKAAKQMGPGKVIVTVLCDSGNKYTNTVYDAKWLAKNELTPKATGNSIEFVGE